MMPRLRWSKQLNAEEVQLAAVLYEEIVQHFAEGLGTIYHFRATRLGAGKFTTTVKGAVIDLARRQWAVSDVDEDGGFTVTMR